MKILLLIVVLMAPSFTPPASAHEAGAKSGMENKRVDMPSGERSLAMSVALDGQGRLWRASVRDKQLRVDYSDDAGKTFSAPVEVNPQGEAIGADGENRPKIAIGRRGEIYVSWTMLLDKPYTGHVRFSRSLDGGRTFFAPLTVNDNHEVIGHRFDALTVGADGSVYLIWLDKRDLVAAKAKGEKYGGSALYYAVSDNQGASFAANVKLADHSCDCCRIALVVPPKGAPVAFWRHNFEDNIRDHALARLDGKGEMRRVSHDEWQIDACPHHGPALAIASDNAYHFAWFDNAPRAHGLFYAQSRDEGKTFSSPLHFGDDAHAAAHPDVLNLGREVFLVWKEFDGEVTSVRMMRSRDGGTSWSKNESVAATHDASDHPQLVARNGRVWLSWNSKLEGYRLIALEGAL